jgi:hypothetical protein
MKHVYSSPDSARIGLVQSLLDVAGIPYEVRNEGVSQAEAGMPFITEIWVLRDQDYEEARCLIQVESAPSAEPK